MLIIKSLHAIADKTLQIVNQYIISCNKIAELTINLMVLFFRV